MKRSTDRIRTTHTGSLPRPPEISRQCASTSPAARSMDESLNALTKQVGETVRKQVEAGIDIVTDGEMSQAELLGLRRRANGRVRAARAEDA